MRFVLRLLGGLVAGILGIALLALAYIWFSAGSWRPVEEERVSCSEDAPVLQRGRRVRVLSWNVQYLAGKNYVFFYDLPGNKGPDERPSPADIAATTKEVARVIEVERPDFVLLQEVDDGARRTDGANQTQLIQKTLAKSFPCTAEAFYWKAGFVPHPRIMGSVGMKVVTFSRFRLDKAVRHALPPIPADPLSMRLGLHRAILEARVPVQDGIPLFLLNTHLDAFAQGTNIMERQVGLTVQLLKKFEVQKASWIFGGDLNLLPPGVALSSLHQEARSYYNETTEITPLFEAFPSAFPLALLTGPGRKKAYTLNGNNPDIKEKPDRTIDYVFHSRNIAVKQARVRTSDTMHVSDHLPLIVDVQLP